MARPCTICTHPKREAIELACLDQSTYVDMAKAAQKIDPKITIDMVSTHIQGKHTEYAKATAHIRKRFTALDALHDVFNRGVGKASLKGSDVVAAAKVMATMEFEEQKMNLFRKFLQEYASNPEKAVEDPEYIGFLPEGFKPGKIEPIDGKDTSGITGKDRPSKN